MGVEIYQSGKHQTSFGMDRLFCLDCLSFFHWGNDSSSAYEDLTWTVKASFWVDDCSANDLQINFQ
jgi:hypothetical protein